MSSQKILNLARSASSRSGAQQTSPSDFPRIGSGAIRGSERVVLGTKPMAAHGGH
jgi:hypothetical protein